LRSELNGTVSDDKTRPSFVDVGLAAAVKESKPMLSKISLMDIPSLSAIRTGLLLTGSALSGQMRPKLIVSTLTGVYGAGARRQRPRSAYSQTDCPEPWWLFDGVGLYNGPRPWIYVPVRRYVD